MNKYYFTFCGFHDNPKGYVEVIADSWCEARALMFAQYGGAWGFQYDEKEFAHQPGAFGLYKVGIIEKGYSAELIKSDDMMKSKISKELDELIRKADAILLENQNKQKAQNFLNDLSELSNEYGMYIDTNECEGNEFVVRRCEQINVVDLEGKTMLENIYFDSTEGKYKEDK